MNPLMKFVVTQMESKLNKVAGYADDVENTDAFQHIVDDVFDYWHVIKEALGDAIL